MAVEIQVESLDKVEEGIRGAYVEADGKFTLDPDRYAEIRAQGLKKKNTELLGKVKESQTSDQRIADLEREVRQYKLTTPLREIALKAGVFADSVDLVLLDTAKRFRLDDDGAIMVLDEHGDPTAITPHRFFEDLYKQQRPRFFEASKAGGSGATNDKKSGGSQQTLSRAAFEALPQDERAQFFKGGGRLTD